MCRSNRNNRIQIQGYCRVIYCDIFLKNDRSRFYCRFCRFYFVEKQIYILDNEATENQLQDAKQRITALEAEREAQIKTLDPNDSEYYTKYISIQETYYAGYSVALELYNEALQGIYIQGGKRYKYK